MANEKDAIISIRMSQHLKSMLISLANTAGVSVSEIGRLLWERDIYSSEDEARRATHLARQIARERYGNDDADRRMRHEFRRLEALLKGYATEDEEGALQWQQPEETPLAPQQEATYEAVQRR